MAANKKSIQIRENKHYKGVVESIGKEAKKQKMSINNFSLLVLSEFLKNKK